jgi:sec-independent protein translocase protein TatA
MPPTRVSANESPPAGQQIASRWGYNKLKLRSTEDKKGTVMGDLGVPELLLILGIALLLFGPRKIGELGKGLGEGIRSFKSAIRGEDEKKPEENPKTTTAS